MYIVFFFICFNLLLKVFNFLVFLVLDDFLFSLVFLFFLIVFIIICWFFRRFLEVVFLDFLFLKLFFNFILGGFLF